MLDENECTCFNLRTRRSGVDARAKSEQRDPARISHSEWRLGNKCHVIAIRSCDWFIKDEWHKPAPSKALIGVSREDVKI